MCQRFTVLILFFYVIRNVDCANYVNDTRRQVDNDSRYRQEHPDPRRGRQSCDTDQLEYRLTRLEVQVAEKTENLRSEIREGNRRLQALEYQCAEVHTALDNFKNEINRYAEISQQPQRYVNEDTSRLERRIDNLAKGMQIFAAALKIVTSDVGWISKNISGIVNTTGTLLQEHQNIVTKQFLTNSLVDIRLHQLYPPSHATNYNGALSTGELLTESIPKNCKDILEKGETKTGIYLIQPNGVSKPFMVLCDMDTRGGGWTYIHNRFEGSQDFFLDMHNYKFGFGNLGGEFWLGLENIHLLTGSEVNELLVELVDANDEKAHAHYSAFSVGSEVEGYSLKVLSGYTGDAGDSLTYHAGSRFSTKDMDQDGWSDGNCASSHGGAWWYRGCDTSNLNGRYLNGELPESYLYTGMYWGDFRGAQYSLSQARMMVRPRDTSSSPIRPGGKEIN
ncbi:unnamed protein product [Brassicogethes aeneus]|uniref:Fibrinogen C-terminal domain-containing protein n=1 Tax=Brassicogethes aeneus TaxID=1431903 RepID=A0A9P0ARQ5_BRAAE|nr:unnamed protein product [Brassicogethes aeneus]